MQRATPIRLTTALALAIGIFAIIGCGGASSSSSATNSSAAATSAATPAGGSTANGAQLSKAQLIAQADAICQRLNTELVATKAKGTGTQDIVRDVPHHVALERSSLAELVKLDPPGSLAKDWQQVLEQRGKLAAELAQLVKAAKNNDQSSVTSLVLEKEQAHLALSKSAKRLGFKDCSTVG
jgi:hypothetical protein